MKVENVKPVGVSPFQLVRSHLFNICSRIPVFPVTYAKAVIVVDDDEEVDLQTYLGDISTSTDVTELQEKVTALETKVDELEDELAEVTTLAWKSDGKLSTTVQTKFGAADGILSVAKNS